MKLNKSKIFSDKYDYCIVFPYDNQVQVGCSDYILSVSWMCFVKVVFVLHTLHIVLCVKWTSIFIKLTVI